MHIFTSMNPLFLLLFAFGSNSNDSLSVGIETFMRFQTGRNFFVYKYSQPVLAEQRFSPFLKFSSGKVTIRTGLNISNRWTQFVSVPLPSYAYGRFASVYAGENWIKWQVTDRFMIQAGRQFVKYGTGRLFSVELWNIVPVYPDMVRIRYNASGWFVETGGGWFYPVESELTAWLSQKGFHVAYLQKDSFFLLALSEYSMGRDSFIVWRHTVGGQIPVLITKGEKFLGVFLEGYFQFGVTDRFVPGQGIKRIPVRAFMSVLRTQGKVKRFMGEVSAVVISGQPLSTLNDFEGSFYAEMGLWHRYYGFLDWYWNPATWGYAGLMQLETNLGVRLKNWQFSVLGSIFRNLYMQGSSPFVSYEATFLVRYFASNFVLEVSGTYGKASEQLRNWRALPKIGPVPSTGYVIWTTLTINLEKNIK